MGMEHREHTGPELTEKKAEKSAKIETSVFPAFLGIELESPANNQQVRSAGQIRGAQFR